MHLTSSISTMAQYLPSSNQIATTVCIAAALEMAALTATNLFKMIGSEEGSPDKPHLSANLSGAIWHSLCAIHLLPGAAQFGGAAFTLYSLWNGKNGDAYKTSQLIYQIGDKILQKIIKPCTTYILIPIFFEKILEPIWTHLVLKIIHGVAWIFSLLNIPEHPTWYGVAALVTAGVIYRSSPDTCNKIFSWIPRVSVRIPALQGA